MTRKTLLIGLAAVLILSSATVAVYRKYRRSGHEGHAHARQGTYLCPMHPEIVQDKPGKCPICSMDLQFKEAAPKTAEERTVYLCPMHPEIVQDKPGKCPICSMDLQPAPAKKKGVSGKREILHYRHPMRPDVTSSTPKKDEMGMDYLPVYAEEDSGSSDVVEGRALTGLKLNQQQLIGIKTAKVERMRLEKSIMTYGRVAYDPELYHAQEEYLAALEISGSSIGSPLKQSGQRGRVLLESARTRLKLLGLSNAQIKDLEKSGQVDTRLILGPQEAGKVWIYADIYEADLPFVRVGQRVEASAAVHPGHTFSGKIAAIDPVLNPKTRSVRVRAEVFDPKSRLKPEVFVDVTIRAGLGKGLSVPETAVLDSGTFQLVFVDLGSGNFEPRKIRLGRKAEGYREILEGLKAGEKVVVNGNFLLDAESQLRGAAASMTFYKGKEAAE